MRSRDRQPNAGELALWRQVVRELTHHEPASRPPRARPRAAATAARVVDQGRVSERRTSADGDLPPAASPPSAPARDAGAVAAWHEALHGVAPLPGRAMPPAAVTNEAAGAVIAPPPTPAAPARSAAAPRPSVRLDRSRPVDLDRRTWLKLRRGLYPIDARLDLHGLTQNQAHQALDAFLAGARTRGHRCVLVITGRGLRHGGTLRAATPRWLDTAPLRPRILAYADAQLRHGGDGALYVLLRRAG